MRVLFNLVSGLLFGFGLVVGGMTNPAKILNFLDVSGSWDPSLAFVLGGAVLTTALGYRLALLRAKPVAGDAFVIPKSNEIDMRLVLGALLFGAGWGLVGYCPGPALAALSLLHSSTVIFVVAMLAGMFGARFVTSAK